MSGIKSEFDHGANSNLQEWIETAHSATKPGYSGIFLVRTSNQLAMHCVDQVYRHLEEKLERAGSPVFEILVPVPPLEDQIALDRQQFPTLDEDDHAAAWDRINFERSSARSYLETLRSNANFRDDEKLLLIQRARLHLYSATVLLDRLTYAAPDKRNMSGPPI